MFVGKFNTLWLIASYALFVWVGCKDKPEPVEFNENYTASQFNSDNAPGEQEYFVSFSSGGNFQTSSGLRIFFPAASTGQTTIFEYEDGTAYAAGVVKIKLKEWHKLSEMILTGQTCEADDEPIYTVGQISINAYDSNNKPLKLAANKKYTISFPPLGLLETLQAYSYIDATDVWTLNSSAICLQPTPINATHQLVSNQFGRVQMGNYLKNKITNVGDLTVTTQGELAADASKMYICYKDYPSAVALKRFGDHFEAKNIRFANAYIIAYGFYQGTMYYTIKEITGNNSTESVAFGKTTSSKFKSDLVAKVDTWYN